MSSLRPVLGTCGAALAAYGVWLATTRQDTGQLVEILVWLVAGVLAHDGLVAGVVLALGLVGSRLLPAAWRAPAVAALVVWGSLTLAAVPVLGRFGARPDNPTLLDRPYLASWLVLTTLVVVATGVAGAIRARRARLGPASGSRVEED